MAEAGRVDMRTGEGISRSFAAMSSTRLRGGGDGALSASEVVAEFGIGMRDLDRREKMNEIAPGDKNASPPGAEAASRCGLANDRGPAPA